ncbi:hypothetical protein [Halomonas stenophila]|uniref:Uncharacterized protein n=1 Tax=Halomonas stenophila TaxID=795312 RepID=A0A7W5ETN4_9GAMM|nr:hypothetical protein [Halomonas stenophila]MBB3231141.1 hypothetical protein [Halomonas stenophila]
MRNPRQKWKAYQLHEWGWSLEEIATAFRVKPDTAASWIDHGQEAYRELHPWHEGLPTRLANYLKAMGLHSREEVQHAFQRGQLYAGVENGLGEMRYREIIDWLGADESPSHWQAPPPLVLDLSPRAHQVLRYLARRRGVSRDDIIERLLLEAAGDPED